METTNSKLNENPAKGHPTWLPWVIWGLAALFYFYEFMLQISPNVMADELQRDFAISAAAVGNLGAFYFYAYGAMQIPVGVLLDRFGPRRLTTTAVGLCAIGCFVFATTQHLLPAQIGRMLIGAGSAFAIISCFKLVANWFPHNRFAMMAGLTVTIGMLGAASGEIILAHMVEAFHWRPTIIAFGFIGIALMVLIWLIVRDAPTGASTSKSSTKSEPLLKGLKHVVRSKQTWLTAIYAGLMFAPTIVMGAQWGNRFLTHTHDISRVYASTLTSLIYIGWAVGGPFTGFISDYMGRRKPLMIIGTIGALLSGSLLVYEPGLPIFAEGILLFLLGLFSSGFFPAFSLIKEINAPKISATALGFTNMLNTMFGAILQPFVGYMLKLTNDNYTIALATLPISMLLALVILPFIKETYCKQVDVAY